MKSLLGRRFSCLVVIEYCHRDSHGKHIWKCLCDCGKKTFASSSVLSGGRKESCGHLKTQWRDKFRREGRARTEHVSIDDALEELGWYA